VTTKRNHKKKTRKHSDALPLRDDQKTALIPGGPVSAQRAQRDDFDLDVRGTTAKGAPIVFGQIRSTLVRKLVAQDTITQIEAGAADLYERDHAIAYQSSTNPLASLIVDGGSGSPGDAMARKAFHGNRLRDVNRHLGDSLSGIASAALLYDASFTNLGARLFPEAPRQEQAVAGKAMFVVMLKRLTEIYEDRQRPIHLRKA
jgi:hypothetical protein